MIASVSSMKSARRALSPFEVKNVCYIGAGFVVSSCSPALKGCSAMAD